jgi:D-sedoheptulose 7-phosphate isomerase
VVSVVVYTSMNMAANETSELQLRNAMKSLVRNQLAQSIATLESVMADENIVDAIVRAGELTATAMRQGGKLMVAGNGGSAADSQHLVAEFVSRLTVDRPALRAIALTVDSSIITAIGNDYSYDNVFERQIEALGQRGDVFLGISTSGNSKNVIKALKLARDLGIATVGFLGNGGGEMQEHCDYSVIIPSRVTMNIQESHLALEHIFCMVVERCYFGADFGTRPTVISE